MKKKVSRESRLPPTALIRASQISARIELTQSTSSGADVQENVIHTNIVDIQRYLRWADKAMDSHGAVPFVEAPMVLHKNVLRWPAILDRTADPVTPITNQEQRVLLPAYLLRGVPLAWECTECRKLFSRPVEEVLSHPAQEPPDSVRREFEHHRCALHLLPN